MAPGTLGARLLVGSAAVHCWNPAVYLQGALDEPLAVAFELRCQSNGGLVALEAARSWVAERGGSVLIACADRWGESLVDRWCADATLVFGDGGAAVTVSTSDGPFRLEGLATASDPLLVDLHRGGQPMDLAGDHSDRVDLRARAQVFLESVDRATVSATISEGMRRAVDAALGEARLDRDAIDHVVLPFFGRNLLEREYLKPLGFDVDRTTWETGRRIGHLGAGDQYAGLHSLVTSASVRSGEVVALLGAGSGFTWSCAVLRVV